MAFCWAAEDIGMKAKTSVVQETIAGYLFLAPNLIGFVFFTAFPVVCSLLISFASWNLLTAPTLIGARNYSQLLTDNLFWQSLWNTFYFSLLSVPFSIGLALLLSIFLNQKISLVNFFRSAYFIPTICSTVAIALIWQWLFDTRTGLINYMLSWVHLGPFPWLSSPLWAMPSVVMVAVWRNIGFNMVIFLAGLQGVPVSLYEAARIDGANAWQLFWNVTWPTISPTTFFVTVTSMINSFQVFDITTVLTNGGPANATNTLVMLIYQYAFQFFRMGYASAVAYILFGIVLVLTIIQTVTSKRWVHY
jgi:multiple sugar transport system permease protein